MENWTTCLPVQPTRPKICLGYRTGRTNRILSVSFAISGLYPTQYCDDLWQNATQNVFFRRSCYWLWQNWVNCLLNKRSKQSWTLSVRWNKILQHLRFLRIIQQFICTWKITLVRPEGRDQTDPWDVNEKFVTARDNLFRARPFEKRQPEDWSKVNTQTFTQNPLKTHLHRWIYKRFTPLQCFNAFALKETRCCKRHIAVPLPAPLHPFYHWCHIIWRWANANESQSGGNRISADP